MKLTKKLPTKPGWYWFQEPDIAGSGTRLHIVELRKLKYQGIVFSNVFRSPTDLKSWPGLWAGPIKEPTNRKRKAA